MDDHENDNSDKRYTAVRRESGPFSGEAVAEPAEEVEESPVEEGLLRRAERAAVVEEPEALALEQGGLQLVEEDAVEQVLEAAGAWGEVG
jgi:hypothetical protein